MIGRGNATIRAWGVGRSLEGVTSWAKIKCLALGSFCGSCSKQGNLNGSCYMATGESCGKKVRKRQPNKGQKQTAPKAHWETKGRFCKRVVLANVPSFRFSFRGNMRTYPRSGFRSGGTSECTLPHSGLRSGGTSAKTTLLENHQPPKSVETREDLVNVSDIFYFFLLGQGEGAPGSWPGGCLRRLGGFWGGAKIFFFGPEMSTKKKCENKGESAKTIGVFFVAPSFAIIQWPYSGWVFPIWCAFFSLRGTQWNSIVSVSSQMFKGISGSVPGPEALTGLHRGEFLWTWSLKELVRA